MFSSNTSQVSQDAVFIEDVMSTFLYTGNGSTQTITNGIDLSTKGGLVWTKIRSAADRNALIDSARGINKLLNSDATFAQATQNNMITALTTTGYTLGTDGTGQTNLNTATYASWTFRKQPKFFDVVTWSGNGASSREIPHALGSTPGCVIAKRTNNTSSWSVYHRGVSGTLYLNLTNAAGTVTDITAVSATTFTVDISRNASGSDYVAYLFAHDAGGFGLTGTDNVISCGSYTGNGSTTGPVVDLGYEPQWVMVKRSSEGGGIWTIVDNMRGMPDGGSAQVLIPNTSDAEFSDPVLKPLATGFQVTSSNAAYNGNGSTIIYIAIRRGPMKVPESGTSVFAPVAYTGNGAPLTATPGVNIGGSFVSDSILFGRRTSTTDGFYWESRLPNNTLFTAQTWSEGSTPYGASFNSFQNGVKIGGSDTNASGVPFVHYAFGRAPGFMDVVCYTGNGSNPRTINHNLGVVPELMIVKRRNAAEDWSVYCAYMSSPQSSVLFLNLTDAQDSGTGRWNNTAPTSTVFSLAGLNTNGGTYVNYLFASCPGVSKCGSFTGNGSSQTINCGFTAGARFVLVKATSTTGDWLVADSARGIVSGNDPYLELNTTNAEVTGEDWLDTDSSGFVVNEVSGSNANTNGVTYIYLAIA